VNLPAEWSEALATAARRLEDGGNTPRRRDTKSRERAILLAIDALDGPITGQIGEEASSFAGEDIFDDTVNKLLVKLQTAGCVKAYPARNAINGRTRRWELTEKGRQVAGLD